MCSTCGCGEGTYSIEGVAHSEQKKNHVADETHAPVSIHHHYYYAPVYYYVGTKKCSRCQHDHGVHHHDHEQTHYGHHHHHDHHHGEEKQASHHAVSPTHVAIPETGQRSIIEIEQDILAKNDLLAVHNREHFIQSQILVLNLVSSPGSGKTTLLVETLLRLQQRYTCAVIEGDQQTPNDADRIRATGTAAIQINTGKGCHLDANMVHDALHQLTLEAKSILFIENVGNLVCPAGFDLGEHHKVAVLSVTEGEDKPLKYPNMFAAATLLILNKIDLLPYVNFDVERCINYAKQINPDIEVILLSAHTGEGMDQWLAWLELNQCV